MTRNMDRRVEVGCPIVDPAIRRARIHRLIDVQRADNTKARLMRSDGTYQPVVNRREPVDSQQTLMDDAIRNAIREKPAPTLASRLKSIFSREGADAAAPTPSVKDFVLPPPLKGRLCGISRFPLEGSWPRSGRKGGRPAQKEPVRGKPGSRHSRLYFLAAQRKKAGRPFF